MGEVLARRIRQSSFESPAQEALLNVLVAAGAIRELVDRACAEQGLTQGQYNVLRILRGAHPAGYPRCEIGVRLLERAPDVTRLIDRLAARGLVERLRGAEDRRQSVTRITRAGLDVLRKLDRPVGRITRLIESRLTDPEARELSRLCEALYGADGPS
ncbi:MAG: MarR family transcriptional regulator [Vicinamibacterales bacterium]|nr:MarR family transcriptional regulator [Vicinamibacterales bacterium]